MKRLFLMLFFSGSFFAMERPARLAQKPAVAPNRSESKLVKATRSFFQRDNFITMIDEGYPVSFDELNALADVTSNEGIARENARFWFMHGMPFTLRSSLPSTEPADLRRQAAKKVSQNLVEGREKEIKYFQNSPPELKALVLSKNLQLLQEEFSDLLGVFNKEQQKLDPNSIELKEKRASDLWQAVLAEETMPFALKAMTNLRHSFKIAGKEEPQILDTMINGLVKKGCNNILQILDYLHKNDLFLPLTKKINEYINSELAKYRAGGPAANALEKDFQRVKKFISATPENCWPWVKQEILRITGTEPGLVYRIKSFFAP